MRKFMTIGIGAVAATMVLSGAAHAGVTDCDAKGNRQENGAMIGALAGAVIGNNVSNKGGAPIVGALAGAAAGSAIGCEQQKMMARDEARTRYTGNAVATTTVNIRAKATTSSRKVGQLRRGERVEVLRYEGDWAVVGYRGNYGTRTTGFVYASYVRPAS